MMKAFDIIQCFDVKNVSKCPLLHQIAMGCYKIVRNQDSDVNSDMKNKSFYVNTESPK